MVQLRARGERDLEATVEQEPVEVIGSDPPTHAVGRLEDHALDAPEAERPSAREPGEARPDDADVDVLAHEPGRAVRRRILVRGLGDRTTGQELYEPDEDQCDDREEQQRADPRRVPEDEGHDREPGDAQLEPVAVAAHEVLEGVRTVAGIAGLAPGAGDAGRGQRSRLHRRLRRADEGGDEGDDGADHPERDEAVAEVADQDVVHRRRRDRDTFGPVAASR